MGVTYDPMCAQVFLIRMCPGPRGRVGGRRLVSAHGCARAPPPQLGSGGASQQEGGLVAGMQMSWGSEHGRGAEECLRPRSPTHTPGNPDQDGSTGSWAQCLPLRLGCGGA